METERTLYELINSVRELDADAMAEAEERQAYLAKPPGSLGPLSSMAITGIPLMASMMSTLLLLLSE